MRGFCLAWMDHFSMKNALKSTLTINLKSIEFLFVPAEGNDFRASFCQKFYENYDEDHAYHYAFHEWRLALRFDCNTKR